MKKPDNIKQDAMFKSTVPRMPEGYYSGDKPNPNLRAFVEEHLQEKLYDPVNDDYDIPAFDKPIKTTKATAIYNMHTYWSKKPHDAIRQYITHYTEPGDLVLDPFCGSGGTALAALMEGRKAIAIDRSPAATFITKNYCTPVDVEELQKGFAELKARVKPEIDWLYETRCDRCGGLATTAYTVYSQVFQCPRCLQKMPFFDCVEAEGKTKAGKSKKIKACPHCFQKGQVEEISARGEKFGAVPVLVSYLCEGGCKPQRDQRRYNDPDPLKREYFEKYDLGKLREIEEKDIPYWYPKNPMIKGRETCVKRNLEAQGVYIVSDLFTKRNLWGLAAVLDNILQIGLAQSQLLFIFTSILWKSSIMMAHNNDGIGRIQKGTYYIPQIIHDVNVWRFMEEALGDIISGYRYIQNIGEELRISTSDARFLDISSASIDYIFTDPPYAEKVQYGELNFVWETWLGFDTHWHDEEIIVNEVRGKTIEDWTAMMKEAISECYRVLKPGRWLSLCYHDTSEGTWSLVQDLFAEVGFILQKHDSAVFIDTKTKTTNQYFADKVTKRDLVINFRKPRPGELASDYIITDDDDPTTFREKLHTIIRDYLSAHPGSTKDHIYDEVVSRMVRAGQMQAHNFDELLQQVAEEVREPVPKNLFEKQEPDLFGTHEIGRWYLKEKELDVYDEAETTREDAAATKLEAFMEDWLKKNRHKEGVHYSDLLEYFLYAVKDRPRRLLQNWLPDYFYKTNEGTFRLPANDEEREAKARGRALGINRRIKRLVSYLEQGIPVPEKEYPGAATLAEWIRQCKLSGLYQEGIILYEKGGLNLDHLSEENQVNLEEDYQVCLRMLNRD